MCRRLSPSLLEEPERKILVAKSNVADTVAVGAQTLVEAGIVLSSPAGQDASAVLVELLAAADAIVIEFGQRRQISQSLSQTIDQNVPCIDARTAPARE